MIHYHPDIRFLTDYASGSMAASQALCVASHLHYCAHCRAAINSMENVAGSLFTELAPVAPAEDVFDRILDRIDIDQAAVDSSEPQTTKKVTTPNSSRLPEVISHFAKGGLDKLKWNKIGKGFRYSYVDMQDKMRETSLFYINAGQKIPRHAHQGDEITVVLKGSFSDQDGCYQAGDFLVRAQGEKHSPVAAQDEDCLCLSTLDAPISMTNWLYKALIPLVKYRAETA